VTTTRKLNRIRSMTIPGGEVIRQGLTLARCARFALITFLLGPVFAAAQAPAPLWTFAVSGDSRNCGDFVMPAIAAKVRAEGDTFYWHLGDFRWISQPDEDLIAMQPAGHQLNLQVYQGLAWDDFLTHQIASFGSLPVFLGRGNHENVAPMTREGYVAKFSSFLNRPEIAAQRITDGAAAAPPGPWYHWTQGWVDFITLDNASKEEFTAAQLKWLRFVLDRDLAPNSGVRAIVVGMHEALPHSTGSEHAMDDWENGERTGELVYTWLYDAQVAGKHVYVIASHSHYYSPGIFNTQYWKQYSNQVLPGLIIGSAGARRYQLPKSADKEARTHIYGFMQGAVQEDGSIVFALHELSEDDLNQARWPSAPPAAIHDCFVNNAEPSQ
jgi:Calcineurin-like phosphoesterase